MRGLVEPVPDSDRADIHRREDVWISIMASTLHAGALSEHLGCDRGIQIFLHTGDPFVVKQEQVMICILV